MGTALLRATTALYWAPGTENTRPFAWSSSAFSTRKSASSHMNPSPRLTCIRSWNSVLVKPGTSAVTVTPASRYSCAAHSLKRLTHALAAP